MRATRYVLSRGVVAKVCLPGAVSVPAPLEITFQSAGAVTDTSNVAFMSG